MVLVEHGDLEASTFNPTMFELIVSALDGFKGLSSVELVVCSQSLASQVPVGFVGAATVVAAALVRFVGVADFGLFSSVGMSFGVGAELSRMPLAVADVTGGFSVVCFDAAITFGVTGRLARAVPFAPSAVELLGAGRFVTLVPVGSLLRSPVFHGVVGGGDSLVRPLAPPLLAQVLSELFWVLYLVLAHELLDAHLFVVKCRVARCQGEWQLRMPHFLPLVKEIDHGLVEVLQSVGRSQVDELAGESRPSGLEVIVLQLLNDRSVSVPGSARRLGNLGDLDHVSLSRQGRRENASVLQVGEHAQAIVVNRLLNDVTVGLGPDVRLEESVESCVELVEHVSFEVDGQLYPSRKVVGVVASLGQEIRQLLQLVWIGRVAAPPSNGLLVPVNDACMCQAGQLSVRWLIGGLGVFSFGFFFLGLNIDVPVDGNSSVPETEELHVGALSQEGVEGVGRVVMPETVVNVGNWWERWTVREVA